MPPDPDSPSVITAARERFPADCFQEVLPAAQALRPDEVLTYNVDADTVAGVVEGNYPEIEQLIPEMKKHFVRFEEHRVRRLVVLAYALRHINDVCTLTRASRDELPATAAEAELHRVPLRFSLIALANRKVIDPRLLDGISNLRGYRALAADLRLMTMIARDNWAVIQGKCALELADIDRASELASIITRLHALRKETQAVIVNSNDLRARVYTLLWRDYNETRRMVTFLRWHEGDVDEIAPSLCAKRKPSKKAPQPVEPQANPASSVESSHAPPTPSAPAAAARTATPPQRPDDTPGADPFMD